MKTIAIVVALSVLAPGVCAQSRPGRRAAQAKEAAAIQSPASQLPIRRVILYSNGVAYFERRGRVSGRAEINLAFKQSQVDDVLKSLVVLDLGRGRIGAVSYNSSAPASARLSDIPFSIEAATDGNSEGGLAGVLRQLQGARVTVSTASRSASGAVLTVKEQRSQIDAEKPPLVTHQLVIASDAGEIVSFDLGDVRSVRLLDEGARHDLTEFANASASARRRDAKTITVTSEGPDQRELLVSYTIAAPIWKTTYRVVMDESGKPFFQGWAVVDNVGDEDWTDVQLSLVSGTPVSFIQPIQLPLYRYRPVIPIPEDLNIDPQMYQPGISYNMGGGEPGFGVGDGTGTGSGSGKGPGTGYNIRGGMPPPAPPSSGPVTSLSDAIASEESGVEAAATGNQLGDLFEYRIDQPITVRRDRSALIPILQARMEGERVSIYNERAQKDRPMSGLRLKNTSNLTLEGGPLTVLDGNAYAGEALIERLKPGEERFISFAVDLGTLVTARAKNDREPAFLVRAINGALQAHYYQTETKTYRIANQTDQQRVVYVEHPVRERWALSSKTQRPAEQTASFYRFRVEVGPRESIDFPVTERRALMDSYAISNITSKDLEIFVSRRYIDQATRDALDKVLDLKGRIAALTARLQSAEREAAEISADQARLRENIKALRETEEARQLIARYVAKAAEQETRIEQMAAERKAIDKERAALQAELDAAIRALDFSRTME